MKYKLPDKLEQYKFPCEETNDFCAFYQKCKRCRKKSGIYRQCWESHVRATLKMDCDIENEQNIEEIGTCPSCSSNNIVGCAFNSYICESCGTIFTVAKEEQKNYLGDEYLEIDEVELREKLAKV